MRIALVSQEFPPETTRGGIGAQTVLKARGLAALGHEVVVVSHSVDMLRHESRDGGVRVVRIPGGDAAMPVATEPVRWLTYSAAVAAAIARLHRETPLDLVDVPEYGGEGYLHLLNRADWNRIPTVAQLHGPLAMMAETIGWPEKDSDLYRVGREMEGSTLRMADAVYSSSRCSARWAADAYGLDVARIPVLHAGVDISLFHPLDTAKADRPTIVFVGRVAESKGAGDLVEAACRIAPRHPGLHLRLIGRCDAAYARALALRAEAAGCPALLELPGPLLREALPVALSRAHLFAAPSRYEGGPGFVYLEAMACGLPAIACAGSGAAEAVRDGDNGRLVPPGDAAALAEVLDDLLSDPAARGEMGRRARAGVERDADCRVCVPRIAAFYADVLGRRPA